MPKLMPKLMSKTMLKKLQNSGHFMLRPAILLIPLSLSWLISGQFASYLWLRVIFSLIMIVGFSIISIRHKKRLNDATESMQFFHYLSYLLERLHEGHSITATMIEAPERVEELAAEKTDMNHCLRAVARALKSGQSLSEAAACVNNYAINQDALIFFLSLDPVSRTGKQLITFIRQQHQMIFEKKHILETAQAGIAQQKTEAWLLCLMPYLVLYLTTGQLRTGLTAAMTPVSHLFYMAGFLFSVCGAFMTSFLLTESSASTVKEKNYDFLKGSAYGHHAGQLIRILYNRLLPAHYTMRLYQNVQACDRLKSRKSSSDMLQINSSQKSRLVQNFFSYKGYLCLLSLPAMLILTFISRHFIFLLLPPFICLVHDMQIKQTESMVIGQCRYAYPQFIHLLTSLVLAGFSVHHAARICTDLYNRQAAENNLLLSMSVLQTDLRRIKKRLDMAWSGQAIMTEQAQACLIPEARAAFNLLARYDQSGSRQLMHLMDLQASSCWHMMHLAVKKQLETRQLKLLLPMMMNLCAVIIIAITPSVQALL